MLGAKNHWFCNDLGAGEGHLEPKTIGFVRFLGVEKGVGSQKPLVL